MTGLAGTTAESTTTSVDTFDRTSGTQARTRILAGA